MSSRYRFAGSIFGSGALLSGLVFMGSVLVAIKSADASVHFTQVVRNSQPGRQSFVDKVNANHRGVNMGLFGKTNAMPKPEQALPGRAQKMDVPARHFVSGHALQPPFPAGMATAMFGLGCFWGAERVFWETQGVYATAVGYAAGHTPNPMYKEVCSGM